MLVLLRDQTKCPACGRHSVRRDIRRCISCNARLHFPEDSFALLKQECVISYWLFTKDDGWKHSAHLENPRPYTSPIKLEQPDKNYGQRPVPA